MSEMTVPAISAASDIYHPEWLAFEKTLGPGPIVDSDIQQNIANFGQMGSDLTKQWPALEEPLTITEEIIEPEKIKVRIYRPQSNNSSLPLMLYFHGGGFISGNLDTEEPACRIIAAKTPCVVVNVDYPLAPSVNMDQIIQSGLRSIEWAKSHSPPLTTSSHLLLAGGSAGGTLATQLTYHLTQQPTITPSLPPPTGLILIQPTTSPAAMTPYTGPFASSHKSAQEKATGAPNLNNQDQRHMITIPQMSPTSPAHFPLLAPSLPHFPRTYIVTAEHDPTRDDGKILARRIATESNVGVVEVCYKGMPHWFQWYPSIPMAHVMMARMVKGVKFVLGEMTKEEAEAEV